ncbi:hypothetical protein DFP72DRAFT_1141598 [Ephemerocybe angulata]|uniref:Uncharacterized protein n=1 Tax=Ephemerocybe angulata TaxID=980116 RepID=A0A8H6HPF1_9AGAR|nr:hypothetical protein DFP72DRAFT_1141598 [Tulosesus angulatus]
MARRSSEDMQRDFLMAYANKHVVVQRVHYTASSIHSQPQYGSEDLYYAEPKKVDLTTIEELIREHVKTQADARCLLEYLDRRVARLSAESPRAQAQDTTAPHRAPPSPQAGPSEAESSQPTSEETITRILLSGTMCRPRRIGNGAGAPLAGSDNTSTLITIQSNVVSCSTPCRTTTNLQARPSAAESLQPTSGEDDAARTYDNVLASDGTGEQDTSRSESVLDIPLSPPNSQGGVGASLTVSDTISTPPACDNSDVFPIDVMRGETSTESLKTGNSTWPSNSTSISPGGEKSVGNWSGLDPGATLEPKPELDSRNSQVAECGSPVEG